MASKSVNITISTPLGDLWQLSAPGGNYQSSAQYQHKSKRDTFTVITQWSVPAAPEPPKIEFPGFWSDAPKAEEAKP